MNKQEELLWKELEEKKEIPAPNLEIAENYYQSKAENTPAIVTHINTSVTPKVTVSDPLSDQNSFILTLRNCGCEIPEDSLKEVLNILIATDKLKDVFMTIASNKNQKAMLASIKCSRKKITT